MKFKTFSWVILVCGILLVLASVPISAIPLMLYTAENGAIGIIGGAGIPTYQLAAFRIMNSWTFCFVLLGLALVITALFCLIFPKTVQNSCSAKTTAVSLSLSAVGGMGLGCLTVWYSIIVFHEMSQHPISYPVSILLGIACFVAFVVLIALHFKVRKPIWSIKGLVIDVCTSIIYLPTFFFAFSHLYEWINKQV